MKFIDMHDYSATARALWWSTSVAGLAVLAGAAFHVATRGTGEQAQILALAATAAIVGFFPLRIPGTKMSFAGAEIFIFLALLLYGAFAAIIVAAFEGTVASWRTSKRWTSRIGTPAVVSVAMLACGVAFELAREALVIGGFGTAWMLLAFIAFGLAYFAASTAITSTLLALKRGEPLRPLRWWADMSWIALAYATSATIAGLLFATFERFGLQVLLVSVPMISMFLYAMHAHFARRDSERRHFEELEASESKFHGAFTDAAIGMALLGADGRVVHMNRAFCDMLARPAGGLLLRDLVHPEDFPALERSVEALLGGHLPTVHAEVRAAHGEGRPVWMVINISVARDWRTQQPNLVVLAHDVSARRQAEAELYHNAYHDSLTGLANRKRFSEQLAGAIAVWQRHPQRHFAVMYLDFDRFKNINDSLGHRAGDELLAELGKRLVAAVRPSDLVARLGGDEFAILVLDLEHDRQALDLADRVQRHLSHPFTLAGIELAVTASIGITFSSNNYESADQAVRDADLAMYQAKSRGKAQYALFDSSLHRVVSRRLVLESQLRHAILAGELFLVYQPIYAVESRRLVGFEALVRWRHPEHGVLEPSVFVPLAEETGLIGAMGAQVMDQACRQLAEWQALYGTRNLRMSVNVSGLELKQPDFVGNVRRCLVQAQVLPPQLLVEVTETVLMDGVASAVPSMRALRDLGVAIGIDDFGTGYSSLGYLSSLPFDVLKVDRCFIQPLGLGEERGEIAKAIVRLGHALDKQVIAEGVETPGQLAKLREIGCSHAQGYLFAQPLDAKSASTLVRSTVMAAETA